MQWQRGLAMAFLLASGSPMLGDEFEARVYESASGKRLPYRLLKPQGYQSEKRYPLVLFLHGAGERGDDNQAQLVHGAKEFLKPEYRSKFPCFFVAPQCPKGASWSRVPRLAPSDEQAVPGKLAVELVESLCNEFSIDRSRLYLTGLSMGGYGTWDILTRHPDMFAAAIPICGGGDVDKAKRIAKIPVWVFHGEADPVVRVELSRKMVAALKEAGGSPQYTEYPRVGHDSWTQTYANVLVIEWLFAQKK